MGRRVRVHPAASSRLPADWSFWASLEGDEESRSRTTETIRTAASGIPLHLKRHRYPLGVAVRSALRHTLVRTGKLAREYRMLEVFRDRAGAEVAPAPLALGERRTAGLLRAAFLATETVTGAASLSREHLDPTGAASRLGRFLRRLRDGGVVHGRLFARNVLAVADGSFRVVDLDRARAGSRRARARWAADLARLFESLATDPDREREILTAFAPEEDADTLRARLEPHREDARRQLRRRG